MERSNPRREFSLTETTPRRKGDVFMKQNHLFDYMCRLNSELHNHLRDTDQKRDHLLEMYITIVLAVFSGIAWLLSAKQDLSPHIIFVVFVVLLLVYLLGLTVSQSMINARKWHAEYMNASAILQAAIVNQSPFLDPELVPLDNREDFAFASFTTKSFLLSQLCVASTLAMGTFLWYSFNGSPYILMAGTISIIANFGVTQGIAKSILVKAGTYFWGCPQNSWYFTGFLFKSKDLGGN